MKKLVSLLLTLTLLLGMAAFAVAEETVNIRYVQFGNSLDDMEGMANDRIKKAIEEKLNITLEYDTGTSGLDDRIMTELIAGTGADLFYTWGETDKIKQFIEDESVWCMSDIVDADPERYPVLYAMFHSDEYRFYNEFYAGDADKAYALYSLFSFATPPFNGVSVYNSAILAECGYEKAPATLDEFVAFCLKAAELGYTGWWPRNDKLTNFAEMDKTIAAPMGTSIMPPSDSNLNGFAMVGEDEWKLMTVSEESKAAVKLLAELYAANGLSNGVGVKGDFDDAYAEFGAGTLAAANFGFGFPTQFRDFYNDCWAKANPDAQIADLTLGIVLEGSGEYVKAYDAPFWMSYHHFIPKTCEYPDRVLDLIEYLASDEGQELLHYGIEGIHFNRVDGEIVFNVDEWIADDAPYGYGDGRCKYCWFVVMYAGGEYMVRNEGNDWFEASMNPIDNSSLWATENDKALYDYAWSVLESEVEKGTGVLPLYYSYVAWPEGAAETRARLKDITVRYLAQMIGGQLDVETAWLQYVAEYEAAGALEIEKMLNEAIKIARETYGE